MCDQMNDSSDGSGENNKGVKTNKSGCGLDVFNTKCLLPVCALLVALLYSLQAQVGSKCFVSRKFKPRPPQWRIQDLRKGVSKFVEKAHVAAV